MIQSYIFDLKTQRETMKGIYCYTLLLRRSVWELVKRDPQQQHLMGPNMFFLSDSYYPILNFSSHSANKTQEYYFVTTPPPPLFIDVTLSHNSVSVVKIYQAAIHIQNTSFLLPNTRLHWCYETLNPLYTLYVAPAKLKKTSLLSGKYSNNDSMNVAKLQGTEGTEGSADLIKINRGIDINKNLLDPLKYVR